MTKPALLLFDQNRDRLLDGALDDQFGTIRLWQSSDPDAVLAAKGDKVIATLRDNLRSVLDGGPVVNEITQ